MRTLDVRYWHKADIAELHCTCPLLGVKRTCLFALHMSAYDPKRTFLVALHVSAFGDKADIAMRSKLERERLGRGR